MDITLPKRIDGQQPVSLNGRQQITVVGANGSGKTRFVNRMIADLGNRAFTISALKALYPIKDGDIQAQSVTTFYQQALQSVQFVKPVAETEFEMLLFMLLNDEMNDMFTYKIYPYRRSRRHPVAAHENRCRCETVEGSVSEKRCAEVGR